MHGFLFHKLKRFTEDRLGEGAWEKVMAAAEVARDGFNPSLSYPREDFANLFSHVAQGMDKSAAEAMEEFGLYLAPNLVEVGCLLGLVQPDWKTLDLVENLRHVIHSALHSINPQTWVSGCLRLKQPEKLPE